MNPPSPTPTAAAPPRGGYSRSTGLLPILREWTDALVIAFVLAMFVRVFVVELFKIPTGSMTPTLLGDYVAEIDWDRDGTLDLVVRGQSGSLVFINKGDRYEIDRSAEVTKPQADQWMRDGTFKPQYDRILVNKLAYLFSSPKRGDVIVFKVPLVIWDPAKPIYIKRAVGLPGETIDIGGRLKANGEPVEEPDFFRHQRYINEVNLGSHRFQPQPYIDYEPAGFAGDRILEVRVPGDGLYVLGDNTDSSLDSRYWGVVPVENVKGRAFLRYWPINKIKPIR
jgi:signal peptidase I